MSFKEQKYTVIKSAISKELADFAYQYLLLKRKKLQEPCLIVILFHHLKQC